MSRYEFGYSWIVVYVYFIPLALAAIVAALVFWRRWPRWLLAGAAVVAAWSLGGLWLAAPLVEPMALPTSKFLAAGGGRVLDVGAGSGRAAVGVLLARPNATVVGLDLYEGDWGIDDNTPERFVQNAGIAGAAHRATAQKGDMRALPFADREFDAVVSSYAMDHLRRSDTPKALAEVARVLKPTGEFLLLIVNPDWTARLLSPHAIGHHRRQDPVLWRGWLEGAGFAVEEEGIQPATLYFYSRKPRRRAGTSKRR